LSRLHRTLLLIISSYVPELVSFSHDINQYSEIAFEDVRTSAIVAENLASWGIEVIRGMVAPGLNDGADEECPFQARLKMFINGLTISPN